MRLSIVLAFFILFFACKNQDSKDLSLATDVAVKETLSNEELAEKLAKDPDFEKVYRASLEFTRLIFSKEIEFKDGKPDPMALVKMSSNDEEYMKNFIGSLSKGQDKVEKWMKKTKKISADFAKKYPQMKELDQAAAAQVSMLALEKLKERTGFDFMEEVKNLSFEN